MHYLNTILIVLFLIMVDASVGAPSTEPVCESIIQNFCTILWDKDHQGSIKLPDGQIQLGFSKESNLIKAVAKIDLQALIDAKTRLPEDLKTTAQKHLESLENLLKNENDSREWLNDYNRWNEDWINLLNNISELRTAKLFPAIGQKLYSTRDPSDWAKSNREYYKLFDEITLAKYQLHPNWQKLKIIFEKIRLLQIEEIRQLPYPDDFKNQLIERTKQVQFNLPLRDLDAFDASKECAEDEINARYDKGTNSLTVCIGLLNALASESSSFLILAHELAHSIAPTSYIYATQNKKGLRLNYIKDIIGIRDQPLSCSKWKQITDNIFKVKIEKIKINTPYDNLAYCLDGNKQLRRELHAEYIDSSIEDDIIYQLSSIAENYGFTDLVVSRYDKFGKEVENPLFMRPELYLSSIDKKNYFPLKDKNRININGIEIFYQALQCHYEKANSNLPIKDFFVGPMSPANVEIFKSAIEDTRKVMVALLEEQYHTCGDYCEKYILTGMARDVDENFADWFSYRVFARHLKTISKLEQRRKLVESSVPILCAKPSVENRAIELAKIQASYSKAPHSMKLERMKAIFNNEVSKLLSCRNKTQGHWGSCKPTGNK